MRSTGVSHGFVMTTFLLVPIHLDALFLANDRLVVEAVADFSRLPYIDRNLKQEINADTANISEEIVSQPFANQNLPLKAGIHLHWALPDALTKGVQELGKTQFPLIPDRWLVIRRNQNQPSKTEQPSTQAWVVESNYAYPPTSRKPEDGVAQPVGSEASSSGYVPYTQSLGNRSGSVSYYYPNLQYDEPFRFVGRKLPLHVWLQEQNSDQTYLETLTAVGYGEPTFAAFYPNCHSLLGFHDDESTQNPGGLEYEVFGWYSRTEQDFLRVLIQKALGKESLAATAAEVLQLLRKQCLWSIANDQATTTPDQMLCYGKLNFETECSTNASTVNAVKNLEIAVGNTPMEALTAYLSSQLAALLKIDPNDRQKMGKLEDQLELLHLASSLENQELDLAQTCQAVRHETGFQTVAIDPLWTIQAETPRSGAENQHKLQGADANNAQVQERLILPLALSKQLRELNALQRNQTKNQNEVSVGRRQLFSDWYKFMLAAYPPQDANRGDDYPDIDAVCYFIQTRDIEPLERQLEQETQLKIQLNEALDAIKASLVAYNCSTILRLVVELSQQDKQKGASVATLVPGSSHYYSLWGNPQIVPDVTKTFGYCLHFGVDDGCELKDFSSQLTQDSLAISIWFKKTRQKSLSKPAERSQARRSQSSQSLITLQTEPGTATICVQIRDDDRLFVQQGDDKWFAPTALPSDRWHHLALNCELVESTLQMTLYVDGKRQIQFKSDRATVRSIYISSLNPTGEVRPFQGQIAQICLDKRALSTVEIARETNRLSRIPYVLQQTLDQRYWQPNEPVILMTGDDIKPTQRHGQDGRHSEDGTLACAIIPDPTNSIQVLLNQKDHTALGTDAVLSKFTELSQTLTHTLKELSSATVAFQTWKEQPWNPILMEWEVQMQPAQTKTNAAGGGYAYDVITENYTLSDSEVDLEVKQNKRSIGTGTSYSNACILTSQAGTQFVDKIKVYLEKNLLDRGAAYEKLDSQDPYYQALQTWYQKKPKTSGNDDRSLNIATLKQWYEEKPLPTPKKADQVDQSTASPRLGDVPEQQTQDPIYIAMLAYETLFFDGKPKYFLSQSLSGFNAELLMCKQTLQLPVEDPLSFDNYQQLTEKVRQLLGDNLCSAPEPLNQFSPIRAGAMKITRLRLIDTFGQVREFNEEEAINRRKGVLTPQRLTVPHSPHLIWLPPRLVQPARLDFQWLAATEQEQNSTPVCGWILPDIVNGRLAIYDEYGKALGTIAQQREQIQWEPAPGSNRTVDEIENVYLNKLVQHILSKANNHQKQTARESTTTNYLNDIITAIESALNGIDPKNSAQCQSLALLVGRPLAVVRASLNIELQGNPAASQGWQSFRLALNRTMRETDNFTRVQFPIRVGECYRFNDGIIGYWKEAADGYEMDKFYLPKLTPHGKINHPDVVLRNHRWLAKQKFFDSFKDEEAEQIWKQLLEKEWLQSMGNDACIAKAGLENERKPLDELPQSKKTQIEEILKECAINPLHIMQSIDSPPQAMTLLIDPRGLLHATSGILPTKTINLAPEDYIPALEAIEITFLSAPILSPQGVRSAPLPMEPGFTWSWLEHKPQISKAVFLDILQNQESALPLEKAIALWKHLLDKKIGWLEALDKTEDIARIIPMGRRKSETLLVKDLGCSEQEQSQLEDQIERLFWAEIFPMPTISKPLFMRRLFEKLQSPLSLDQFVQATGQDLWSYLLSNEVAWLKPLDGDPTRAEVAPKENRITPVLNVSALTLQQKLPNDLTEIVRAVFEVINSSTIDRKDFMQHLFEKLQPVSSLEAFSQTTGQNLWSHLLSNNVGWLKVLEDDPTKAEVIVKDDQRLAIPETNTFAIDKKLPNNLAEILETIFDSEKLFLTSSSTRASFGKAQELREGWLVLSKVK